MTTLEYDGLALAVGDTPILDTIHLRIDGPGLFSLLGPSGVGKSSLLRATQRLIEGGRNRWRRSGDVRLNGRSIFSHGLRKRDLARRIGFVQQRPRMLSGSIRANVEFALRHTTRLSRQEIRHRAEAAIEHVGLAAELASLEAAAWELSGGQAQRLAIARAIALEPEVLLMDEPISSLDPMSAERVAEVIQGLARDRLIVLVTHKVGLAVRLAQSAGFLLRGAAGARLVEVGDAPEIFENPTDPVAKEFVRMGYGAINAADREAMPGDVRASADSVRRAARQQEQQVSPRMIERLYLFICGRNTSRSPMAQAFCNAEIARRLGVESTSDTTEPKWATSAGLAAEPMEPMSAAAESSLRELGLPPHQHATQTVSAEMVADADTIFCMTVAQCRDLAQRFPTAQDKIERLDPISDLEDPNGRGPEGYLRTARRIDDAVRWQLAGGRSTL